MSIFEKFEKQADTLLQELKEHILHQTMKGNKIDPTFQDFVAHLEAHVTNTPVAAAAPVAIVKRNKSASTPVVSDTVVVEEPIVEPVQHTEDPDHIPN